MKQERAAKSSTNDEDINVKVVSIGAISASTATVFVEITLQDALSSFRMVPVGCCAGHCSGYYFVSLSRSGLETML